MGESTRKAEIYYFYFREKAIELEEKQLLNFFLASHYPTFEPRFFIFLFEIHPVEFIIISIATCHAMGIALMQGLEAER